MLVQRGVIQLADTVSSNTITLDTPVSVGESFVIATCRGNYRNSALARAELVTVVSGEYTQLTVSRGATTDNCFIEWQVISGPRFIVQHDVTNVNSTAVTETINQVDLGEAFIVFSFSANDSRAERIYPRARFTNNQQIEFATDSGDVSNYATVSWYVVEWDGASVQSGLVTISDASATDAIDAVDLEEAFLLSTHYIGEHRSDRASLRGRISTTTQVEFVRGDTTGTAYASYFVIEHPDIFVQSGLADTTGTSITDTLGTAVDLEKSFMPANSLGNTYSTAATAEGTEELATTHKLFADGSDIKYTLERASDGGSVYVSWFAVEVSVIPRAETHAASDITAVSATLNGELTDMGEETSVDVHFEWRETGGASWGSTTPETMTAIGTFDAGIAGLDPDTEYEFHAVVEWNSEQAEGATLTFETLADPLVSDPTPAEDAEISTGITTVGGQVDSAYGRDVRLFIEIDDDPGFTSPDTYTTDYVNSGDRAEIEHAFTVTGTWYIRMTPEDDTAVTGDALTYEITVRQVLYFLEEPRVDSRGPIATHVYVESDTHAASANVTPEPPAADWLERAVTIREGDATVCQEVADRLLERWSEEQISVSGKIPLTVTLSFRERINIVIPQAGIDEEMILQRKVHDLEDFSTTVTLGDIMLSDSELLSRILDELD